MVKINCLLVMSAREREGRKASPGAGVIDGRSGKTTESGGVCGYEAGRKIKGRKRHLITDTLGCMPFIVVHGATIQDRDGAVDVIKAMRCRHPWLRHPFADGGHAGDKLKDALSGHGKWTIQIIKRSDTAEGLEGLPRRWVANVEGRQGIGRNPSKAQQHGQRSPMSVPSQGGRQDTVMLEFPLRQTLTSQTASLAKNQ